MAASLGAEPFPQQWCEPRFPATNGLVRDLVATLEQQLRDISEAELVSAAATARRAARCRSDSGAR